MSNILQDLLRIDMSDATIAQKKMLERIIDEDKVCIDEDRMLCLVDTLLRDIASDLADDGVTNVTEQVDTQTFDNFMARLLSTLNKETSAAYSPYVINDQSKDLRLWNEQDPEFRSYMKMAMELDSMIVNRESFSPSDIISPFIIAEVPLKKKAIQSLIQSPSFQLKPLDVNGKFFEMKTKIKEQQKDLEINPDHSETIVIELDKVLNFNFAEVIPELPELNSTDIENVTALIDEINGNVFHYINDKEELVLINSILRSLLGDLLGVILDLPGKLIGAGGQNGKGKGGGLSITISLGGDDEYDDDEKPKPSPRKRPPQSK